MRAAPAPARRRRPPIRTCPLSALPVLAAARARTRLLVEWNDTARPLPGWTVPERFAAQAARHAGRPRRRRRRRDAHLGELDRRADELARRLRAAGVGPESRVALLLDRTADMPVALLGVWKAGGACVPLDPASPAERLARLLADAEPGVADPRRPARLGRLPALRALDLDGSAGARPEIRARLSRVPSTSPT